MANIQGVTLLPQHSEQGCANTRLPAQLVLCFSFLSTFFIHEYLLIESLEQVKELPTLLKFKWCNAFFTQVHLKATNLLELGSRLLGECKQCCAPISRVRQADQQPLPFESVDQGSDRASGNPQVLSQISHAQTSRFFYGQERLVRDEPVARLDVSCN